MITIVNVDATKFTLNGIPHNKNFTPLVSGNKISIVGTYDSSLQLLPPTNFDQFLVDGASFVSVADLQSALLPVLYSRTGLGAVEVNGNITDVTITNYILTFTLSDSSQVNIDLSQISANATSISNHIARVDNPHVVTKAQLGLGQVDNTPDADKPVSSLQQSALDGKASKTGLTFDIDEAGIPVGSHVFGVRAGINNGAYFEGYKLVSNPTIDDHINFTYRVFA